MKHIEIILLVTSILVIRYIFAGCSMAGSPQEDSTKIKVLVTVLPEADYVQAVGGDRVEVFVAVPPGADPHTFEPSVKDMVKFSGADIYVTLGKGLLPLEDNLVSRLSSMNPRMKVVETSPGIDCFSMKMGMRERIMRKTRFPVQGLRHIPTKGPTRISGSP